MYRPRRAAQGSHREGRDQGEPNSGHRVSSEKVLERAAGEKMREGRKGATGGENGRKKEGGERRGEGERPSSTSAQ